MYIIDNVDANKFRLKCHPACSEDLLKQIDSIIRKSNPYDTAWKMMHEVESEEYNRWLSNTSIPREVKMLFTRNENYEKNRYNNATCNEVAVIFVGNNGKPPIERDICIYSKYEGPIKIPTITKHVDYDLSVIISSWQIWMDA